MYKTIIWAKDTEISKGYGKSLEASREELVINIKNLYQIRIKDCLFIH